MIRRLAIVTSHPVQYYAPWFRHMTAAGVNLRVFYLWNRETAANTVDREFGHAVRWDVDLLGGYDHEFVPNSAARPGTHHFGGLHNPKLMECLHRWKPDVVLQIGYGWRSLLHLALRWQSSPLVLRGDSHDLARASAPLLPRLARCLTLRLLFGRFTAFAAVGQANRAHYLAHGVNPDRIFTIPHCVDNERFSAPAIRKAASAWRRELDIPDRHRVVGFAGKFIAKKQPDLLVRAFNRASLLDTTLVLVGDGVLEPDLRRLQQQSPNVVIAPFQNQSLMPRTLASFDLLVLPSHGPSETWGLIVNEAMAAGVPCLVSDHVGCRADLIEENVTGWSFAAGDELALASTLEQALRHLAVPAFHDRIERAVRHRIESYSYSVATRSLKSLLQAVAGPSSGSSA